MFLDNKKMKSEIDKKKICSGSKIIGVFQLTTHSK